MTDGTTDFLMPDGDTYSDSSLLWYTDMCALAGVTDEKVICNCSTTGFFAVLAVRISAGDHIAYHNESP